ncbi:MAG: hypothetical protein Q7T55_04865 [Solirubrobacteraceae bacterium]|nr:hypothetical protein [Solirubrobacteraceae bacterium]
MALALADLTGALLSSAPAAEATTAVAEADFFGSGHLIALILMPLLAVVCSIIGGYFVIKAAPDPTVGH